MKNVLGIGNALVDLLIRVDNEDLLKELNLAKGSMQLVDRDFKNLVLSKTTDLKKTLASGGSSANTIVGIASLGVNTGYIGKIGTDDLGDFFLKDLNHNHIIPYLIRSKTETGVASTLITPDSERTFGTFLGASVELQATDLDEGLFSTYDILHLEGYLVANKSLFEKALQYAKAHQMTVSLDLASYNVVAAYLPFLKQVIQDSVDIVFANEEEAKALTGKSPVEALDEIAQMCDTAIVKVGMNGSFIKHNREVIKIPAIQADAIDTTGAGDLYAAGFLYGYAKGLPSGQCGAIGALLAGKVVEVIGAKIPPATWDMIKATIQHMEDV